MKKKTIMESAKAIKIQLLRMAAFSYEIDCELAKQKPRRSTVEKYDKLVKSSLDRIRQELDALGIDDDDAKTTRAGFLESQMRETMRETKALVDSFEYNREYPW